jgi:hypothetical protein
VTVQDLFWQSSVHVVFHAAALAVAPNLSLQQQTHPANGQQSVYAVSPKAPELHLWPHTPPVGSPTRSYASLKTKLLKSNAGGACIGLEKSFHHKPDY